MEAAMPTVFHWVDDPKSYRPADAWVGRLPTTTGPAALHEALTSALQLPDHYGQNWDALDECLHDLSWIPNQEVALVHDELPQGLGEHLRTYLAVLAQAISHPPSPHHLTVVFPLSLRERVCRLRHTERDED
jgi:hypothetical protein